MDYADADILCLREKRADGANVFNVSVVVMSNDELRWDELPPARWYGGHTRGQGRACHLVAFVMSMTSAIADSQRHGLSVCAMQVCVQRGGHLCLLRAQRHVLCAATSAAGARAGSPRDGAARPTD